MISIIALAVSVLALVVSAGILLASRVGLSRLPDECETIDGNCLGCNAHAPCCCSCKALGKPGCILCGTYFCSVKEHQK